MTMHTSSDERVETLDAGTYGETEDHSGNERNGHQDVLDGEIPSTLDPADYPDDVCPDSGILDAGDSDAGIDGGRCHSPEDATVDAEDMHLADDMHLVGG